MRPGVYQAARVVQATQPDLAVAAADARKASTRDAARTRELPAGPATDASHTALAARPAAGTFVLAPRSAGAAVRGTAAAARILLEDGVSRCCNVRAHAGLSCRDWHHSHRCSDRSTDNNGFHNTEFGHVIISTPCTHA
jgi:hypothetical protein